MKSLPLLWRAWWRVFSLRRIQFFRPMFSTSVLISGHSRTVMRCAGVITSAPCAIWITRLLTNVSTRSFLKMTTDFPVLIQTMTFWTTACLQSPLEKMTKMLTVHTVGRWTMVTMHLITRLRHNLDAPVGIPIARTGTVCHMVTSATARRTCTSWFTRWLGCWSSLLSWSLFYAVSGRVTTYFQTSPVMRPSKPLIQRTQLKPWQTPLDFIRASSNLRWRENVQIWRVNVAGRWDGCVCLQFCVNVVSESIRGCTHF